MKPMHRFELDGYSPHAGLYHSPGVFVTGMLAGLAVAALWALWWPLGVLGAVLAYCVALCASQVKRSTEHYARVDAEANTRRGPDGTADDGEVF